MMHKPIFADDLTLTKVAILCPAGQSLSNLYGLEATVPFDPRVMAMVGAFSRLLAKDPRTRAFPEIVSLAYWLRPKAIEDMQASYNARLPVGTVALGRGIALHFAPGNVDTIFLYSALLSILAGNTTVVRVSSRVSAQIDLLVDILNEVLSVPRFQTLAQRIYIIRYDRNQAITRELSAACDIRVIWGGDQSVGEIRAFPLAPRSRDVTFPDRWSLSVIDAAALLAQRGRLPELAKQFANDAFWFGQMACSSPQLIFWRGTKADADQAANVFWRALRDQAQAFESDFQPVQFVDKLVAQHTAVITGASSSIRNTGSNIISVSGITDLTVRNTDLPRVGGGLFWEGCLPDLRLLVPFLDRRSQTIASFGIPKSEWEAWVTKHATKIDRIVPFGQALQFDAIWDGMDLLREFTRLVAIRC